MNALPRRNARRADNGFTLIEVVIALAIAALGLGALVAATQAGIGNARAAARYMEASMLAQAHLDEVGVAIPLSTGTVSGSEGAYAWTLTVSQPSIGTATGADDKPRPMHLYDVRVDVAWAENGAAKRVSLRSQRVRLP